MTAAADAVFHAWCLHEALKLWQCFQPTPWILGCYAVLGFAALFPAPQMIILALGLRLYETWTMIPLHAWDSYYWCLNIDGGLLLLLLLGYSRHADRDFMYTWWAGTARVQLALFYLASGFWKINKDFLDPQISCAPIFLMTLLPAIGFTPGPTLASLIAASAPLVTIVGTASFDPWVAAYGFFAVLCARGLMLESGSEAEEARAGSSSSSRSSSSTALRLRATLIALAACYSFGGPLLGLQDLGASNMYSNLRMHGGSNHYLAPTDALATLLPSKYADVVFRTVRVEACTSAWIKSIYPNEITSQMSEGEIRLLKASGHMGRMFNAAKARILTPFIGAPPPSYAAYDPKLKWTVPAFEFRRLLNEARELGETFDITYTLLDGMSGDERWRRTGSGRTVTLSEDGHGGRVCSTSCSEGGGVLGGLLGGIFGSTCGCADDELAMLPPPPALLRKFLVQQPYPIVGEEAEAEGNFICFGP